MNELTRMQIMDRFSHLVDDKPLVFLFQDILSDEGIEVDIHELEDQVDISFVLCF
jgi:hypothetical protein